MYSGKGLRVYASSSVCDLLLSVKNFSDHSMTCKTMGKGIDYSLLSSSILRENTYSHIYLSTLIMYAESDDYTDIYISSIYIHAYSYTKILTHTSTHPRIHITKRTFMYRSKHTYKSTHHIYTPTHAF